MKKSAIIIVLLVQAFLNFSFHDGEESAKAKPGTYQIIIKDNKRQCAFTDQILILIEEKRKDHESVTISLNPVADVYIPSRDVISAPDFKPLEEIRYTY